MEQETNLYHIDWEWLKSHNRSPSRLLKKHMCASCLEQFKDVTDEEITTQTSAVESLKECCAGQPDFLSPNLPIMELLFRFFLSEDNQPKSAREILDHLKAGPSPRSLDITEGKLAQLIESDRFYGLHKLTSE